jgi:carboxyl-terminal processing protease
MNPPRRRRRVALFVAQFVVFPQLLQLAQIEQYAHIYNRAMNSLPVLTGRSTTLRLAACALAATFLLGACGGGGGGGGGGSSGSGTIGTIGTTRTPDPIPTDYQNYANLCAKPRSGVDAITGLAFPDRQGTLLDEMKFLRGWTDSTYLWNNEVPTNIYMADFTNTLDYFDRLKTPAITASGKPKDQFHFTYTTAEWNALNTAGQETGYGVTWAASASKPPRTWIVAVVEPNSPAARAGLQRGDMLAFVDGVDFVTTNTDAGIDTINAGLYPERDGESHRFGIKRGSTALDVTMNAAVVSSDSVKNAKVIDTPTGKVAYLTFNDFNAVAEKQLIDAFTMFQSQGVNDLVIDMRYNGGGLLGIASELGYMIAGPSSATKTFERLIYNSKTPPDAPFLFASKAYGYTAPNPAINGQALPYLGLKHVTVLTTADTCSASESVINGLRGIDVQVDIIGGGTCGKPYGFTPVDNCGTTYFSIQFQGVNAKGFGDYADGFTPTCTVADDFAHAPGDTSEGLLAAALAYRTSNACPTSRASAVPLKLVRPAAKEVKVLSRMR